MGSNTIPLHGAVPGFARAASIVGACALLASCEHNIAGHEIPDETPPLQPVVVALSTPDSLAPGDSLCVVVHYYSGCLTAQPSTTEWAGDTLVVTPWVKIQSICGGTGDIGPYPFCDELTAKVGPPSPGIVPIRVLTRYNFTPRTTSVVAGVAPMARGFVQRFEVVRADGIPVAGATITVTLSGDTLADVVTDAAGRANAVIDAAGSSIDVNEFVRTSGIGSEQIYQAFTLERNRPVKTRIIDRP